MNRPLKPCCKELLIEVGNDLIEIANQSNRENHFNKLTPWDIEKYIKERLKNLECTCEAIFADTHRSYCKRRRK